MRSVERGTGICPIASSTKNELFLSPDTLRMRETVVYLWSKISCHHRVSRPRFPIIRKNFGDLRTVKAYMGLLIDQMQRFFWLLK